VSPLSFPLLSALVWLPLAAAGGVLATGSARAARALAVGAAAVGLALALAAALAVHGAAGAALPAAGVAEPALTLPGLGLRYQLGLEAMGALMLPLVALLGLAVVLAGPRQALDRPTLATVLATTGALSGVLCAQDLLLMLAFWVAALLPGLWLMARSEPVDHRPLARTASIFLLGGSVPLAVAVAAVGLHAWRAGAQAPFALGEALARGLPASWHGPLFTLLLLAAALRMGLFPFHSWLPALVKRGPLGLAVLLVNTQVGLFLLLRVAVPLLPDAWERAMPLLATCGLVSALYGAVTALGQTHLRRTLGFLAVSQAGMVLLALASMNAQSVAGALLQGVGLGLPMAGLLLMAWALESRVGFLDTTRLGGLVRVAPRMATLFLLLGLAAVGLPGTLAFVGEDLLLHGVLEVHPLLATGMLVATALNGLSVLRAFYRTFLGPPARQAVWTRVQVEDLLPRERAVAVALCLLVVLAGLVPGPLLALRAPAVEALVASAPGPTASLGTPREAPVP
jgi:NADH-quinone oxidoreductase subunit M